VRLARFSAALLSLALLTACQVDQDAEVARYRSILDAHVAASGGPREDYDAKSALPFKHALQLANQYNEALASTGEDYLQAIIEHKRTLATFLPTIDFGPQFVIADKVSSGPNPTLNAGFSAGYSNFNAWKQLAESAQTAITAEQKRELLLDAQTQLLQDVVRTYYAAALAEQRVRVLRGSLAVQEERVRDVAAQAQVGLVRALDFDQAKAQAASTRAQLEQARGDAANARAALALLVGVRLIEGELTDGYSPPGSVDAMEAWLKTASAHRSDLAAAVDAVHAARKGVDAKFAQYYPSISLNLDYFVYRETVPTASLYTALFQANIPVFTGQRIHQEVRAEWAKFRQAKLDESLTKRRIEQAVRTAYQNVLTSQARLIELRTQVTSAQDAFNQSVDLLRVGLATNLERLIAQDTLLKSQLDLITEELNHKVVVLELRRAGGLHPLEDLAGATQPASQPARTQPAPGAPRAEAR
jgi:outer membrane protein TolC